VWPDIKARANVSGDTGSATAVEWMVGRLKTCMTEHASCSPQPEALLPTRVLDIRGFKDAVSLRQVRLVETNGETAPYACLSHCWGHAQIARTTRDTIARHKAGIDWDTLSKTFRDAITVASRLDIPYIWIDSLCIVQDDEEDWKGESQKMYQVYSNCMLVIAATKSADGDGGCFAIADDAYRSHPVVDEHAGQPIRLCFRKKIAHESYRLNMRVRDPLPLLTRGWVLQERLLAPRVLHFGPEELVWECPTELSCECGEAAKEEKSRKGTHADALRSDSLVHGFRPREASETTSKYWRDLVVNYSRLKFTFEKDRLVALNGIHTLFKEKRGDTYLAGLWSSSLVRDMLWNVYWTEPKAKTRRGTFPSWSWASVNSHIEYVSRADRPGKAMISPLQQSQTNLIVMGRLAKFRMHYIPGGIPRPNATTYVSASTAVS
jgi:hypothetical protein